MKALMIAAVAAAAAAAAVQAIVTVTVKQMATKRTFKLLRRSCRPCV